MRDLTHAKVLKLTAYATLATALFCIPRVAMWSNRAYPIWYLEAIIFTGAFVLWGFVFAWHTKYTGRPVFTVNIRARDLAFAMLAGITVAVALRLFLDPIVKQATSEE